MFLFFHDLICAMYTFSSSTNNFAHAQALSRMSSLSGRMNIAWVNIEFFTGCKKLKQRHISFVLGYLRTILWKISTAISIKHRILATFSINKKFNSDSLQLYAFKLKSSLQMLYCHHHELINCYRIYVSLINCYRISVSLINCCIISVSLINCYRISVSLINCYIISVSLINCYRISVSLVN